MAPRSDHFAILVAIGRYPGYSEKKQLHGPENDAEAFADWLSDAAGGNVDTSNIRRIYSSGWPPVGDPEDPETADPSEVRFKKVLNEWCKEDGQWRARAGARLYLFCAGHGFTAGSLEDPALLTAQAQYGDISHIAVLRYAKKIQRAGFFDEIVLVMDACQDVLKAAEVNEPTWLPPDREMTGRVALMRAFAAPAGRSSREGPDADGAVRGYFSRVFLEAIKTADQDQDGYVLARSVMDKALALWKAGNYEALTDVAEPPMEGAPRLRLYRRPLGVQPSGGGDFNIVNVGFTPGPPAPLRSRLLATPAPLPGTARFREDHWNRARNLAERAFSLAMKGTGALSIFARDSARDSATEIGGQWRMPPETARGLRLRRLGDDGVLRVVRIEVEVDDDAGCATSLVGELAPGTYLVGVERRIGEHLLWDEIPLRIFWSQRTEVYLDSVDDDAGGRRYDIGNAGVLIQGATILNEDAAFACELARLGLVQGRRDWLDRALDDPSPSPLARLYGAYALAAESHPDYGAIRAACEQVSGEWASIADARILEAWCTVRTSGQCAPDEANRLLSDELPLISRGWELLRELHPVNQASLSVQFAICAWRSHSALWTRTEMPDGAPATQTEALDGTRGLTLSDLSWLRYAPPQWDHSPLQQALRRAVIGAAEDGDALSTEELVDWVSSHAGVSPIVVAEAAQGIRAPAIFEAWAEPAASIGEAIKRDDDDEQLVLKN